MFGAKWLRQKLNVRIQDSLDDHEGELLLLESSDSDTSLRSAGFELKEYMWGFFPLYKIVPNRYTRLRISAGVVQPLLGVSRDLKKLVRGIPSRVLETIVLNITRRLHQNIDKAKAEELASVTAKYDAFHGKFLKDLLRKDQLVFRQKMSTVVMATGAETMASLIRKHIAMLLLKMREEESSRANTPGYLSSGQQALPSSCKFVFRKGKASVFVIEQIPQVRTISYKKKQFRIALPYVVFAATVYESNFFWLQVFFRTSPLENEADELLCPALTNIGDVQTACFPVPKEVNSNQSKLVEEAVQNYWGSNFNDDLSGFFNSAAAQFPQLRGFEQWEKSSKEDPQFVLQLQWESTKKSVSSIASDSLSRALNLKGQGSLNKSTADALNEYADTLGEKFSREITEKIHFMVSHSRIELDSLPEAQLQLAKLIDISSLALKARLEEAFEMPFEEGEIEAMSQELQHELSVGVDNICSSSLNTVISEIKQLQQKG